MAKRHVHFTRPKTVSDHGPIYHKDSTPLILDHAKIHGAAQAVIITPNVGKHENVGWRIRDCELYGHRKFQPNVKRWRVEPPWIIRTYMMSDLKIERTWFRSKVKEHDVYMDLDFEHGDVVIDGNFFDGPMSQGTQFVGPQSRSMNTGWPERRSNTGKLFITNNLYKHCGQWNWWAAHGISRPASAMSVFRCVEKLSIHAHGNHLKSQMGWFAKSQPGGYKSYGAAMFEGARYLEFSDNLIEYKQPSNRDVIIFDDCDEVIAEKNIIKGGKVEVRIPNEFIWRDNKGYGLVKYVDGNGKRHMLPGDVTWTYVFNAGYLTEAKPPA